MKELDQFKYTENLIGKAMGFLSEAKEGLEKYSLSYSNIIANCQNAIELSTKAIAIFILMGLDFQKIINCCLNRRKEERLEKELRSSFKVISQNILKKTS